VRNRSCKAHHLPYPHWDLVSCQLRSTSSAHTRGSRGEHMQCRKAATAAATRCILISMYLVLQANKGIQGLGAHRKKKNWSLRRTGTCLKVQIIEGSPGVKQCRDIAKPLRFEITRKDSQPPNAPKNSRISPKAKAEPVT